MRDLFLVLICGLFSYAFGLTIYVATHTQEDMGIYKSPTANAVYINDESCVINDHTKTIDADLAFCGAHLKRLP